MTSDTGTAGPRPVLLVSSDLLFRSRIDEAARSAGVTLRVATTAERLERHLATGFVPGLVIVDLECQSLDPVAAIERVRKLPGGAELRIVAYASHSNVEAIKAGRAAGANNILARSAFVAQLPDLLALDAP